MNRSIGLSIVTSLIVFYNCSPKVDAPQVFNLNDYFDSDALVMSKDSFIKQDNSLLYALAIQTNDSGYCSMLDDSICKVQKLIVLQKDILGNINKILESEKVLMNELKGLYGGFTGLRFDSIGRLSINHYTHTGGSWEVFDYEEIYAVHDSLCLEAEHYSLMFKTYISDTNLTYSINNYHFNRADNLIHYKYTSSNPVDQKADTSYSIEVNQEMLNTILEPYNDYDFLR